MITDLSYWLVLLGAAVVFWLIPDRFRVSFLGIVSVGLLLPADWMAVVSLIVWTSAFYYCSRHLNGGDESKRRILSWLIWGLIAQLAFFKLRPALLGQFISDNEAVMSLVLPFGISYFTFKLIHYALETRRGNIKQHDFSIFFLYIFFFPIYPAGPIERFDAFIKNRSKTINSADIADGLTRIAHGLIKKFVIAEGIIIPLMSAPLVAQAVNDPELASWMRTWMYVVLFFIYAYLDFSAYSDIAIGSSRLFGFRIMENFNFPVLASNIQVFWQRWHISLSGWCRAYIYMPMIGLTRNPTHAVLATMATIGLWHGATLNWLFWGLYHAVGIIFYGHFQRFMRKRYKYRPSKHPLAKGLGIAFTMVFVTGSYAFAATDKSGTVLDGFYLLIKLLTGIYLPSVM
ncbi:MAG: MBOAT family protein [Magnetococcales bacterium]|nr:MBOAT family protein [Magnetococcales bacterium]